VANSILSSIFGKSATSITNDATGRAMWARFKIRDVEVLASSETTESPISSIQYAQQGAYISLLAEDIKAAKVITPSGMRITGFVEDVSTLTSMQGDFNDQTLTISVSAKSFIVANMMPVEMEISQAGDMLGASKVVMLMEQAAPPTPAGFDPAQSADAPTYGARIQTPPTLTESAKTLYNRISTKLGIT